jgi:hypothetical protein
MAEQLVMKGTLEGHSGWVTSLATTPEKYVCPFPLSYSILFAGESRIGKPKILEEPLQLGGSYILANIDICLYMFRWGMMKG